MEWYDAVEALTPHVVQISTPQASGTGFLLWRAKNDPFCAVATAAHVVDHAYYWEQPLRLRQPVDNKTMLLRPQDRAIFIDAARDTAVLLFEPKDLQLPAAPLALIEQDKVTKIGATIGWLGFPAIQAADLCFFSGSISAWLEQYSAYFVDGVTINGVSGGPAFAAIGNAPYIIGVVSAYMPNRATRETLPGLGIVRDVAQFHEAVQRFRSLDEAKQQQTPPAAAPPPAAPQPPGTVPNSGRRAT